ncbi:uncharacterized protein LOC128213195 isoform X2 [Mya arenaria]|nr:uncharacterized protein LOC128213195 isoform X2 [Mya arenaria]
MDRIWTSIKNNSKEEFYSCLVAIKNERIDYNAIYRIVPFCVLFNRPNLIKVFFTEFKTTLGVSLYESSVRNQIPLQTLIRLATIFGYQECSSEIQLMHLHISSKKTGTGNEGFNSANILSRYDKEDEDYQLFSSVLTIGENKLVPSSVILDHCKILQLNGRDINSSGRYSILYSIANGAKRFSELFTIALMCGADINQKMSGNRTVFFVLYHYLAGMYHRIRESTEMTAKFLKACLYENPTLDFKNKKDVFRNALYRDLWEHWAEDKAPQTIDMERFAPFSYVALMFEAGVDYPVHKISCPIFLEKTIQYLERRVPQLAIHVCGHQKMIPPDVKESYIEYIANVLRRCCMPRSLKDLCKLRLRREYPGRGIHKTINRLHLPASVRDFILMEGFNTLNMEIIS